MEGWDLNKSNRTGEKNTYGTFSFIRLACIFFQRRQGGTTGKGSVGGGRLGIKGRGFSAGLKTEAKTRLSEIRDPHVGEDHDQNRQEVTRERMWSYEEFPAESKVYAKTKQVVPKKRGKGASARLFVLLLRQINRCRTDRHHRILGDLEHYISPDRRKA